MSLFLLFTFIFPGLIWLWVNTYRYIFSGMNIHLPAILGFTRYCRLYQGFDPPPYCIRKSTRASARTPSGVSRPLHSTTDANHSTSSPPRKKSVPLVARITSHGGWDGWKFRVENLGFEGWKFRVFDGFLSIFLYFGLVEGIKSQETMLLNHHNFSLPIRKSRGFAVGKTHLVRLKPSSLAHECGYWGESKAGVVHVHILAVSFRGITQKVRLSIYIICIASLMPMHTHSDIYIYVLYILYIHIYTNTQWLSWRCRPPPSSVFLGNLWGFMGCLAADDAIWRPEERSWTLPDRLEGSNSEAGITGDWSIDPKIPPICPIQKHNTPPFFLVPTWFHHWTGSAGVFNINGGQTWLENPAFAVVWEFPSAALDFPVTIWWAETIWMCSWVLI